MKRLLLVVGLVVATLAALAIRVVVEGRDALARGDEALAAGRPLDAIAGWETAARWYLPLASHDDEAYARLRELAGKDHRLALPAWRAVRSAALATRGLASPHADDLAEANAQIAELSSRDPDGAAAGGPDAASRKTFHLAQLTRDPRPGTLAIVLALVGLAAWIGGVAGILRQGFDEAGKVVRKPATVGAIVAAAGAATWVIGLYNA